MHVCLFDLGFEPFKTVLHVHKEARAEIPKCLTMVDDSEVTQVSKNNEAQVMSCG